LTEDVPGVGVEHSGVAEQHGPTAGVGVDHGFDGSDHPGPEGDRVDPGGVQVAAAQQLPARVPGGAQLLHGHVRAVRGVELRQVVHDDGLEPEGPRQRGRCLAGAGRR